MFSGQKGLIVTLTDKGLLEVSYLGTEPPQLAVETKKFVQRDFKQLDKQYYQM